MKKKQIALVVIAVSMMAIVFVLASVLYDSQQSKKVQDAADPAQVSTPLNRPYAQALGPAEAKVTIVEFFDPGCETCAKFAPLVKGILDAYPGKVKLVYRYAPFHKGSDQVVAVLEAARLQGKYFETLQMLFDTIPEWADHHQPAPEKIWAHLPGLGLDVDRLRADMNSMQVQNIIQQDMADLQALGVRKTPTFIVNGNQLQSFGYPQLQALVQREVQMQYP